MTWQFMLNIYYWFICCQYSCNLNFFFIKMGVLFWPETGEFCSCEVKFNRGRPSNLINDKYQIEYENETRFFGVTCSCTACYCWRHHLSTKFWLGRELFFFEKKLIIWRKMPRYSYLLILLYTLVNVYTKWWLKSP